MTITRSKSAILRGKNLKSNQNSSISLLALSPSPYDTRYRRRLGLIPTGIHDIDNLFSEEKIEKNVNDELIFKLLTDSNPLSDSKLTKNFETEYLFLIFIIIYLLFILCLLFYFNF